MKPILAIAGNLESASARLRLASMVEPLARRGFAVDLRDCPKSLNARQALLRSAGRYHAVLLQRKLLDPWNADVLRRHARRVLFDVDDAVMFHPAPVGVYSRFRTRVRFAATAKLVDHVVAGNRYLADLFERRGCRATVLPTVIDAGRYLPKLHADTAEPRLVWIGSRSTRPYLRRFLPQFEVAARATPGLRLLTISDEPTPADGIPTEHVPWSLRTEAAALALGDIGVAPTPSDRWTQGKCGFKIVQYMAAGLPVIASPVGANATLVRPGETGLLPERECDWPAAIATLARDAALRSRMGAAGRAVVERQHTIDGVADVWAGLLED
jgi:glycosyltransferase involved in cell wall biosynthesis